jgi:hypothetical protein
VERSQDISGSERGKRYLPIAVKVQIGVKRDGEPHLVSQWVPDAELAPRVRQAFEMRAAGASYGEILEATRI